MTDLIAAVVTVIGTGAWLRFTLPVLGVTREEADSDAVQRANVARGMALNWVLALVGLGVLLASHTVLPAALIFMAVAAGAWMELGQGHEGAP